MMALNQNAFIRFLAWLLLLIPLLGCQPLSPKETDFYLGLDLSYVNEMEDCGAVYHVDGEAKDPFQLFQEQGANLVRARLWHNPDWTAYSTLPDVTTTFTRAKEQGMATLLDFHYSDNWADPGRQTIPAAWESLLDDALPQAVYNYTYDVLMHLHEAELMPDFVQVGNETNPGLLKRTLEADWPRDAKLFNAGIQAVRDVAEATDTNPQIILHVAQPENTGWWFTQAREHGVTDFDVIGVSYYPEWSQFSLADMGSHVTYLRQEFGKEVMVVEAGYPWTHEAMDGDTADNVLDHTIRPYPATIAGQRQFMIDLTQSLVSNGALGIVYWEPAWVSTACHTRWGQGSHWENATFFDFENERHAGADFLGVDYKRPLRPIDGIITENATPILVDGAGDSLLQKPQDDLLDLYLNDDSDSLYVTVTVAGDVLAAKESTYLIYLDSTEDGEGATEDVGKRPILVANPYQPEFRLDVDIADYKGTTSGHFTFYAWQEGTWQEITLTGAAAIQSGTPSIIEIQILKETLHNPDFVNVAVVSVGKGRVHTAVDILGSPDSPEDLKEAVNLSTFVPYTLAKP